MSPEQAQAIAEAFREATSRPEQAKKKDLHELELRLNAGVSEIKFDRVKWIAGMLLAQVGLVASLVKLL